MTGGAPSNGSGQVQYRSSYVTGSEQLVTLLHYADDLLVDKRISHDLGLMEEGVDRYSTCVRLVGRVRRRRMRLMGEKLTGVMSKEVEGSRHRLGKGDDR